MALAGEVGGLLAELQWLTSDQIAQRMTAQSCRARIGRVAEVLIYLLRFADICAIDPISEANAKVPRTREEAQWDQSCGSAAKYTENDSPQ